MPTQWLFLECKRYAAIDRMQKLKILTTWITDERLHGWIFHWENWIFIFLFSVIDSASEFERVALTLSSATIWALSAIFFLVCIFNIDFLFSIFFIFVSLSAVASINKLNEKKQSRMKIFCVGFTQINENWYEWNKYRFRLWNALYLSLSVNVRWVVSFGIRLSRGKWMNIIRFFFKFFFFAMQKMIYKQLYATKQTLNYGKCFLHYFLCSSSSCVRRCSYHFECLASSPSLFFQHH